MTGNPVRSCLPSLKWNPLRPPPICEKGIIPLKKDLCPTFTQAWIARFMVALLFSFWVRLFFFLCTYLHSITAFASDPPYL